MENTTEVRFLLPSKEVLQCIIEESVKIGCENFIKQHLPQPKQEDEYINMTEASQLLKRSKMTIYNMIKNGHLTCYNLKGTRGKLFKKTDIISCIEKVWFKYLVKQS